jgi:hypothetical protein
VAGAQNRSLFELEAIRIVHRYSGGIPRVVNNICDNALLTAFSSGMTRVSPAVINEVINALDLTPVGVSLKQPVAASGGRVCETNPRPVSQTQTAREDKHEPASNVRYIRREPATETTGNATIRRLDGMKYRLATTAERDGIAPSQFFQRMRVARCS